MAISAEQVKKLRAQTGAGMMECKKALVAADGDFERAVTILREQGLAAAAKRSDRETREGIVGQYIHAGGKLGVLLEVNCETDFVASTDEFQDLVQDIAMQIAASDPLHVRRDDVSIEEVEKEQAIYSKQALDAGKPENCRETGVGASQTVDVPVHEFR